MSRVLALDYGERRIGVALSDPTRTIASPLATLTRRERASGRRGRRLRRMVEENEVTEFVVGLPLDLEGEEGEWARGGARVRRSSSPAAPAPACTGSTSG